VTDVIARAERTLVGLEVRHVDLEAVGLRDGAARVVGGTMPRLAATHARELVVVHSHFASRQLRRTRNSSSIISQPSQSGVSISSSVGPRADVRAPDASIRTNTAPYAGPQTMPRVGSVQSGPSTRHKDAASSFASVVFIQRLIERRPCARPAKAALRAMVARPPMLGFLSPHLSRRRDDPLSAF